MPSQSNFAPVPPLHAADGTPNTTASLATISPGAEVLQVAKTIFPGMLQVGTIMRLRARGEMTQGTTANTLTIGFYWGGVAGVAIAQAAALATPASLTAAPWWAEWEGEFRSLGPTGTLKGIGTAQIPTTAGGLTQDQPNFPMPQTAAARTVTLDTTVQKVVTVGAAFSAVTGGVSITCYGLTVELGF